MSNARRHFMDLENRTGGTVPASDADRFVLDEAGIPGLFHSAKSMHYPAKEIVYGEGNEAGTVYVIRAGMIKLISHLPNGRARIVRVHSRGAWLGLGGVLGQPYEHTAIAVEDTDAYRIPVHEIMRIKSDNPNLYCRLLECWFDYLQEADLWIAEFSTGSVKARVARLVNFLSEIEDTVSSGEVKLLTCEEMAEILGATPESVSRVLAEFKRSNILFPSKLHAAAFYQRNTKALDIIAQH